MNVGGEGMKQAYGEEIEIIEVGPRDGLQGIATFIDTDTKIKMIKKLIDANIKRIEITSFVHPKYVPQMADNTKVIDGIREYAKKNHVTIEALVPNYKGVELAKKADINHLVYTISASEKYNQKNVRRSSSESLEDFKLIMKNHPDVKMKFCISASFGSPFDDENIDVNKVLKLATEAYNVGAERIVLADTTGVGDPLRMKHVIQAVAKEVPFKRLGVHLHDTQGMGLASTYAALESGILSFESSIGGLGGSPFAPGAGGNIATEDLVNMFTSMGINTGVNVERLLEINNLLSEAYKIDIGSHLSKIAK